MKLKLLLSLLFNQSDPLCFDASSGFVLGGYLSQIPMKRIYIDLNENDACVKNSVKGTVQS